MGKDGDKNFKHLGSKKGRHFCPTSIAPPIDYNSKKPIFSFHYMHYGSETCLTRCDNENRSAIAHKLIKISQLTWSKILSTSKRSLGFETIPHEQFKNSLPSSITPDITMIVFQFSSSGRMAGFRQKDIYHIVQVSSKHNLY